MRRLITIICTLLVALMLEKAAAIRSTTTRSRAFPDRDVFAQAANASVTYADCDQSSIFDNKKSKKSCTVYLESLGFGGESDSRSSCNVTLSVENQNSVIFYDHQLYLFGRDKAILVSYEAKNASGVIYNEDALVKLTIVHFPHCGVHEASVAIRGRPRTGFPKLRTQLVTYADSFDVAFYKHGSCNGKYCRASFDAYGRRTSGPVPWFNYNEDAAYFVQPVERNSSAEGYVMRETREVGDANDHKKDISALLFKDGEIKPLKTYRSLRSFLTLAQSTAHGVYGLCASYTDDTSYVVVDCSKSDLNGESLLDRSKRSVLLENGALAMRNTADGGFLLLTRACSRENCDNRSYDYRATRHDAQGRNIAAYEISQWHCSNSQLPTSLEFYENELGEICASFLCASADNHHPDYRRFDFAAVCFERQELEARER